MSVAAAMEHGPITRVVDGVWAVRVGFAMGPGVTISRTMTIVQCGDGLALFNAARLSDAGLAELDRLGAVKHLVKLSDSHGVDEPFYVDRYRPRVWAAPNAKAKAIHASDNLDDGGPVEGGQTVSYPGARGWTERGYWIPNAGGTLITCDALQHHVDTEQASWLARVITPLMGFKGGLIVASMWRKSQHVHGDAVRTAFAPTLRLTFANLVCGHGPAIVGDADQRARQAIERAATA